MSFFENQRKARRISGFLVVLYLVCVALIICGVYFVLNAIFIFAANSNRPPYDHMSIWNPGLFSAVTFGTLAIVFIATMVKIAQLSKGGQAVAALLNGRLIPPNSENPDHRKVLNVVEEMAIASGMPVPPVYLLEDESGINAFAAGRTPRDAVIGVTLGTIRDLNRDELQGVIAHEFSHIFNGDMGLNLKLVAMLHGILALSTIGYFLFRLAGDKPRGRSSRGEGKVTVALGLSGIALMIIGYVGAFFASLIKSAVSRQREFLADASSVQYTRNPGGIGGALRKIAAEAYGSVVEVPTAEQVSHFFFADGIKRSFFSLFATHPPISARLRQIYGQGDVSAAALEEQEAAAQAREMALGFGGESMEAGAQGLAPATPLNAVASTVGNPEREHLAYSRRLIGSLSPKVIQLSRDPSGARAVVAALLLDSSDDVRSKQLQLIQEESDGLLYRDVSLLVPELRFAGPEYRLPLVSACVSPLKSLPKEAYFKFRNLLQKLIEFDRRCSVFEYAVQRVLRRSVDPAFYAVKRQAQALPAEAEATAAVSVINCLAFLCADNDTQAKRAGQAAGEILERDVPLAKESASLTSLDKALSSLEASPPQFKERLINAVITAISADKEVAVEEAELLRAIAEGIDCPIPPFSPD